MDNEDLEHVQEQPELRKSLSVLTLDAFRGSTRKSSRRQTGGAPAGGPTGGCAVSPDLGRRLTAAAKYTPHQYAPLPTDELSDVADFEFGYHNTAEEGWRGCYLRWKKGDFTIVPEGNRFLDLWDFLVVAALAFTALVLPFDAAMFEQEPQSLHRIVNAIDAIFMVDILMTFNVAYGVTTATNIDMFERAPLKIARRYMAFPFRDAGGGGWFWWDVFTVIPWDRFANVQDFAVLRLLRLTRMFRLVRIIKLFAKWQLAYGYQISVAECLRTIVWALMACHWIACVWGHLAVVAEDKETTWLHGWLERHQHGRSVDDCTAAEVYNLALYWCISTLTSVGFGDVLPQNQLEVALLSFTMILLGGLWAWVLAHMVSILQHMDVFSTETHQLMDDLNLLMKHRRLGQNLRQRCRKHLAEAFHVHRQRHQQRTVKWLSAGLQGEIAVESGMDKACDCVHYLRNVTKPVMIAIAQRFSGDIYSPNEYIHLRYSVAVIRKGTCIRRRKLLTRDDVISEDMILATDHLFDYMAPKSLTFLEVMNLSRSDLVSVCESHPDFDRRLRKAQIKLAVWRAVVTEADARRRGKVSVLQMHHMPSENKSSAGVRRLTFSQSLGSSGLHGPGSPQESLADIAEQLGAMRRRLEDTHGVFTKELSALSGRIDELVDHQGLAKRRNSGGVSLPLWGRVR